MIELTDEFYYYGVWFVGFPKGDWMAIAWNDGEKVQLVHRFRYYHGPGMFEESDDEKSWYEMWRELGPETEVIESLNQASIEVIDLFSQLWGPAHTADFIYVGGDAESLQRALSMAPWAHVKNIDQEEFERLTGKEENDEPKEG